MSTILIIEDAVDMARGICRELQGNGYTACLAHTGPEGLAQFQRSQPDLVILDWMLPSPPGAPKMDGLDVLRCIRKASAVPVLMLTARGDETDRVIGLEVGADDYLVKPFGLRELVARVRALLRRHDRLVEMLAEDRGGNTSAGASAGHSADGVLLRWQSLTLDPVAYQATLGNAPLELTHTEFELLRLMVRSPGRTFTRKYLLETIWDETYLEGDRSVDNAILRLRKKLGPLGEEIETVRSVGYRWRK